MTGIGQDVRLALRGFRKDIGFTIVALLVLALGIGANASIFSIVDAVLLQPLPFSAPEQLVAVGQRRVDAAPGRHETISWPTFRDWSEQSRVFSGLAAYHDRDFVLSGAGDPELLRGIGTTANMFSVLGETPQLGRGFAAGEDQAGKNRVVVISNRLWARRFASDPAIIGRSVTLDGEPYVVIGVARPTFRFPVSEATHDLWAPLSQVGASGEAEARDRRWLQVVGRLASGMAASQALAELQTVQTSIGEQHRAEAGRAVTVTPLKEEAVGGVRAPLLLLLGGVMFVLLIVCANLANLLLARALGRQRDIAIRTALGASRTRIVRQLLIESGLLSLMGGGLGVLLALWSLNLLVGFIPADVPRPREIAIDGRVLAFAAMIALATGVLFGIVPALVASQTDVQTALKQATRTSSNNRGRARTLLLMGQVALAFVLLVGGALSLRSFGRLAAVDPGFEPRGLLTASMSLSDARYPDRDSRFGFYRTLSARLQSMPGAQSTAVVYPLPFSDVSVKSSLVMTDREPPADGQHPTATMRTISPSYFSVMGIRLLRGRLLQSADDGQGAMPVAVISETLARRHWPGQDPIGRQVVVGAATLEPREIVGVVSDVKTRLDAPGRAEVYIPFGQAAMPNLVALVRGPSPESLVGGLQAELQAVDRALPLGDIKTMEQRLAESLRQRRLSALLLGMFAALALILASVGIYGVMSYSMSQRTREFGIRLALGSPSRRLLTMVVGQGLKVTALGLGLGAAIAAVVTRLIAGQLYGISPNDPLTYLTLATVLLGSAAVAALVPARRAARVDPMISLRQE